CNFERRELQPIRGYYPGVTKLARWFLPAALVLELCACTDKKETSEKAALEAVNRLLPIVKQDVEQIRKGLPEGAAKLGAQIDPDAGGSSAMLQSAIANARGQVKALELAKSTFFSFVDTTGVVLKSESDPDYLAGKNVFSAFPVLKKALEPQSGVVEVFGEMQ